MHIVRADGDDWKDWRALRQRSLNEDPDAFAASVQAWTGDDDTEEHWRERILASPCFLARYASREPQLPVGMVGVRSQANSIELISMWVAPEARGRGVGGALIDEVLAWSGNRTVYLRVMDGNDAAVAAYQSRGFSLDSCKTDGEGCRSMTRRADRR